MTPKPTRLADPPDSPFHEPDTDRPTGRIPVDVRGAALTVLAVLGVILVLQYAQAVLIPIVLGVLISYALDPIVSSLARLRVPRALASAIVLLAVVAALGVVAYGVRSQVSSVIEQLPQAARRVRQALEREKPTAGAAIKQVQTAAAELEKAADAATSPPPVPTGVTRVQVQAPPMDVGKYLVWGSMGLVAAAGQTVLILFLAFFLLASGDLSRRKLVKIVGPSLEKKKITVQILDEINRQIASFMLVLVFTSTIVAVATWLAFRAMGLEQAAVFGLLAGICNSIPYLGPVVVTSGATLVAFLQFGSFSTAFLVGAVALAITALEGFLLLPWLSSRAARMNAVAIFIGLLFWGWVWNVWGMLLAVPMLVVIKAICDHVEDFKGIGELLGE